MDDHVDNEYLDTGNDPHDGAAYEDRYEATLAYFVRLAQPGRGDGAMGRRLQGLFVLELLQATDDYNQSLSFRKPENWLAFLVDVVVRSDVSANRDLTEDLDAYYHSDPITWETLWRHQFQAKLADSLSAFNADLTNLGLPRLAELTTQVVLNHLRTAKSSLAKKQLGNFVNDYPLEELALADIFVMLPRLKPLKKARQQDGKKGRYDALRKRFESLRQRVAQPWHDVVKTWVAELDTPLQGHHTLACLPAGLAAFRRIHEVLTHHLGYESDGYLFAVFYKLATDASQGRTWSAPAHYGGSEIYAFFDIYNGSGHELELVRWGLSAGYLDTVVWLDEKLEQHEFPALGHGSGASTWYEYIDHHSNIIHTLGLAFATEVAKRMTASGGQASTPKAKPATLVARHLRPGAEGHV